MALKGTMILNGHYNITQAPSLDDIVGSLISAGANRKSLSFITSTGLIIRNVAIKSLAREDGSGKRYVFEGEFVGTAGTIKGYFDVANRVGFCNITVE